MASARSAEHWLDQYGSKGYRWQSLDQCERTIYYRPLGLVEFTFDADGRYLEGRADLNAQLDLEAKCNLSNEDSRERIMFAWTCLRCKHLLLQSKSVPARRFYGRDVVEGSNMCFAVEAPRTIVQAIEDAARHLVFLEDHFDHVDPTDFWVHCQNVARIINPEQALSRMFVYKAEPKGTGRHILRFFRVTAHQIEDGLTSYTWMRDFIGFLNQSVPELRERLRELMKPDGILERLPTPQEALYPPVQGNRARRRWFWLLTRILRHVRKPLPAGFLNPLRRHIPRARAIPLSPIYSPLLDYTTLPPLNSIPMFAKATVKGTERLHRLCKEAKGSVGAGCFALAALIMMEMYEEREPDVPLNARQPFISGFPLNPRAFFNHSIEPDSLMLAFSDGISLPFLPSNLDLDGRLRLLIRQAHRQLAAYQKRQNQASDGSGLLYMGSRGAGRLLATQYVGSIERLDLRAPEEFRRNLNPQGAYPMRPNMSMQTNGVSSVGRREHMIKAGMYDLDDESKDFVADYRNLSASVRPRDEEFLVGIGGQHDGLWVNATIDGNAMDPSLVEKWRVRFESMLDNDNIGKPSKL